MFNQIRDISAIIVGMSLTIFAQTPIKKEIIIQLCKGCEVLEVSLNGLINEIVVMPLKVVDKKVTV